MIVPACASRNPFLIEALLILIAFFPYDCGIKPENADRLGVARGVLPSEPSDLSWSAERRTHKTRVGAMRDPICVRMRHGPSLRPARSPGGALRGLAGPAELRDFNATRNDTLLGGCVHRLFESAAAVHKNSVALLCAGDHLSYEQLNLDANRLAHVLRDKGVRRGDLVGVCLDRSIDLVVALLGVLKTGAAYVPVDPSFPAERIGRMPDQAKPALLITPPGLPDPALHAWSDRCLGMDRIRSESAPADGGNLDPPSGPADLTYFIFTSGSTEKPKGVEVTHGSLSNFLLSMRERPGCTETDRLLAITTISFDIAALELFLPLLCGASVVIAQPRETVDGAALRH